MAQREPIFIKDKEYAASKIPAFAANGIILKLQKLVLPVIGELAGNGIRVNTIVPGPTNTPMMADIPDDWMQSMLKAIPLGRMGETHEIARVAAFLASEDAAFITGQNLAVNGGMAFI